VPNLLAGGFALLRFLAGGAACLLFITGAFLFWQSHAANAPSLPDAPPDRGVRSSLMSGNFQAPEATAKSREERRFSRTDKNKDGKIEAEEVLGSRRKAFAKLDTNGNRALSFEEWAAKTIGKFQGADKDRNGILTTAEFATTAPLPLKRRICSCRTPAVDASSED